MQFDARDGFRPDDRDRAGKAGDSPKAANGISAAKAGLPVPVLDGQSDPHVLIGPPARSKRIELSLTQILGSTAAAVTAAFLGSRLGVAGTLIGAGLASVISVVGGALYTTSLRATRQQVAKVLVGRSDPDAPNGAGATPVWSGPPLLPSVLPSAGRSRSRPDGSSRATRRPRPALRGAFVGALLSAVVFVGALLVVTGVESVTGTALSGGSAGSLTILGGNDSQRVAGRQDARTSTTSTTSTPSAGASTSTSATSSTAGTTTSNSTGTAAPGTGTSGTAVSGTGTSPTPATATPSATGSATPSTTGSPTGRTAPESSSGSTAGTQEPAGSTMATTAPATSAPAGSAANSTGGTASPTGTSPTTTSLTNTRSSTSGRPAPGALIVG